jgi:hypothetical protein
LGHGFKLSNPLEIVCEAGEFGWKKSQIGPESGENRAMLLTE